jgi:DNA polymerase III alpha subunit
MHTPDIDIDFKTDFDPRTLFPQAIPASMVRDGELAKHPCGHYFQHVPVDNVTGWSAIPYEEAEVMGYFKIDFLHLSTLEYFESKAEIRALLKREPQWDLLLDKDNVLKLFQISKHHAVVSQVRPKTIQELADVIALIRPGKRYLLADYIRNKIKVRPMLYRQDGDDKSSFKRSHSLAYAMTIVLQLHLIEAGVL